MYVGTYSYGGEVLCHLNGNNIKDNVHYADIMLAHIEVFGIADYYDIPGLKTEAKVCIQRQSCYWSPVNFSKVLRAAYKRSPPNDRRIVQQFIAVGVKHMTDLTSHTEFKDLVAEHTDYAVAICTSMGKKVKDLDAQLSAAKEAAPTPRKRKTRGQPLPENSRMLERGCEI